MTVYRCTLCGKDVTARIESGDACPHCGGSARTRSLPALLDEQLGDAPAQVLRDGLPLLVFAPLDAERKVLAGRFAGITPVTLYGNYGPDLVRGVDARDLSGFADGSFAMHLSLALFDYFTEHENALAEAFRVLAPGGVFATLIIDARVRDDASPPAVAKKIEKKPGYYDYWPDGVDLLSVSVGKDWLVDAIRDAGFDDAQHVTFPDPISGYVSHWFTGRKPEHGRARPKAVPAAALPSSPPPPSLRHVKSGRVAAVGHCTICGKPFAPDTARDNCPSCNAPSRLRSLPLVWDAVAKDECFAKPLLGFALTTGERRILGPHFPAAVSASLYGDYGAGHINGVDARDLSRFSAGEFACVFSILLFDYFFEHDKALREAARVLERGGLFMTCILDSRVSGDGARPAIIKTIERAPGYFDYVPADKALLSVHVGSKWFLAAMKRAGFSARYLVVDDAISTQKSRWFVGRKR